MSCPRCTLGDHSTKRRADGVKHKATMPTPSTEILAGWILDGDCEATDGCSVEPDGRCEHGHSSWLLALRMI